MRRIEVRIQRMEDGNLGDHKHLGKGVWEARFTFGPGYRLYFAKERNTVILLLAGGDKSTQSTDMEKAVKFYRDYKEHDNA